jgi:prepilin-type processing-associated H-X9-DG protein
VNNWLNNTGYMYRPSYLVQWGINLNWPGASSRHPGACNALLFDGSVRGLSPNVGFDIWCMLNGISDGLPVPSF